MNLLTQGKVGRRLASLGWPSSGKNPTVCSWGRHFHGGVRLFLVNNFLGARKLGLLFERDARIEMCCNFEGFSHSWCIVWIGVIEWPLFLAKKSATYLDNVQKGCQKFRAGCVCSTMTSSCNVKITGGIQHLQLLKGRLNCDQSWFSWSPSKIRRSPFGREYFWMYQTL